MTVLPNGLNAESRGYNRTSTRPSGIQWVMQKLFGGSYRGNNLGKLSGVRTKNLKNQKIYGVRSRSIRQTLNRSSGISNSRRLLGPRKNLFGGSRKISGFRK